MASAKKESVDFLREPHADAYEVGSLCEAATEFVVSFRDQTALPQQGPASQANSQVHNITLDLNRRLFFIKSKLSEELYVVPFENVKSFRFKL